MQENLIRVFIRAYKGAHGVKCRALFVQELLLPYKNQSPDFLHIPAMN